MKHLQRFVAATMAGFACVAYAAPATGQEIDWSGFYLGGNIGLHNVNTSGIFDASELGQPPPDLAGLGDEGFNLGIQGGYNFQIEKFVLGVEGDLSFGGLSGSIMTVQDGSADEAGLLNYPIDGELSFIGTIRGRVGFDLEEVFGRSVLVFGTAGVAFTDFEMNIADGRSEVGFKDSGLTWGGGIEIPVSPRVTVRGEYLHIDFGEQLDISGVATSGVFDANDGNTVKLHDVDMVRFGVNILFGAL
jgi:outer membrane immunogenic protein